MPELVPHAPDNPDFARVIEPRMIRDLEAFPFDIAPTPSEAAAVARLLGAREVRKLRLHGALNRLPKGGWRLDARLGATAVQTCVVTLDPVTTRVDQPVARIFLPAAATASAEVVVDLDDEVEPLGDRIDLGLVAIEALALALPTYPRRPGATLGLASAAGQGVAPLDEAESKPFAALAALRGKSGHGS
jgi:uncharacterized metal-binding protein YceD (DUF177 family)